MALVPVTVDKFEKLVIDPTQVDVGENAATGFGRTMIVAVLVFTQPFAPVTLKDTV